jgi:hypothetical protein
MVNFLKDRYFNYDFHKSSDRPGSVFAAGSHWVSFSRLAPHIIAVLDTMFGPRASWPDPMATLLRELMRGEHDKECVRLCVQLPANLDLTPAVMQKRLTEMFVPLARALRSLLEQAALANADMQQKKTQDDTTTPGALAADGAIDESTVGDGDVTDALASQASLKEKVGIVNQLNRDAKLKRERDTRRMVLDACMQLLRSRIVVCATVELLKCYMESQQAGLVARTVIVDGTMIASRQSGAKSRSICLAMTKSVQEELAQGIKILPATPVVGNVLIRSGNHSVDVLEKHLQNTHSHRLHCVVPVVVAEKEMRFIRSGIRRANGPTDDEASGIDFIQRTIGKRRVNEETGDALDEEIVDEMEDEASGASGDDEADQNDVGAGDTGDAEQSKLDRAFSEMTDPALMPEKVLKELFGARANDIKSILFQHTTRIGTPAEYLAKAGFFQWRKSEMSHYRKYRKGQVHPSVYISVLSGVLASSNVPITNNEILVDITGGTPEVMVAGIVLGFKKVAFIAEGVEEIMMSIPTMDDQRVHSLNYDECPSLNPGKAKLPPPKKGEDGAG